MQVIRLSMHEKASFKVTTSKTVQIGLIILFQVPLRFPIHAKEPLHANNLHALDSIVTAARLDKRDSQNSHPKTRKEVLSRCKYDAVQCELVKILLTTSNQSEVFSSVKSGAIHTFMGAKFPYWCVGGMPIEG